MSTQPAQSTDTEPDEVRQIHIHNPDKEFTCYTSPRLSPADSDTLDSTVETREISLSEGGGLMSEDGDAPTPSDDLPFITQNADGSLNRVTTHQPHAAVGYFLHNLEIHDIDREHVMNQLKERASESDLPYDAYTEFVENMSEMDRKLRLMDMLEARVEQGGDWAAEPYLDCATWRTTNLGKDGKQFAERLARNIDLAPLHCYRTAQDAAIKHADNHLVTYVEGIVLPTNAAQVIRHAWIEYDGEVVELTFPWHRFDGGDAVYFGVEFDADEVKDTYQRRGNGGTQLILSDEEYRRMTDIQHQP